MAQTGKSRSARIPLDYYKKPDRLQRMKTSLTWLAIVVAIALVIMNVLFGSEGKRDYSRGHVANVHATWNDQCEVCHVPFHPIMSRPWLQPIFGSDHASNVRCANCHAGPPHHANQTPALACADCHRDHRGREASLVALPDQDCTRCHANLKEHMVGSSSFATPIANAVRSFISDHPEFRAVQGTDPGRLKFSHKRHMSAGMLLTADGTKGFTLADIRDPKERERYRRQQPEGQKQDSSLVQLSCQSCHRLDSGDFGVNFAGLRGDAPTLSSIPEGTLPPRRAGKYMITLTYENQCQACHPTTFDPNLPDVAVPHRLQPPEVRDFLFGVYASRKSKIDPARLVEELLPKRQLPGTGLSPDERQQIARQVEHAEAFLQRTQLTEAERKLYLGAKTCGECHHYHQGSGIAPDVIEPPNIPQVWFRLGRFDHSRHRAIDCRLCHPNAYPTLADGKENRTVSEKSADILIPGRNNCLLCHRPKGPAQYEGGTILAGGARFDCTECHQYHHRETDWDRLQGRGAAARDPKAKLDLKRFLQGVR
ncbi:MAG: hypothetical protein KatS3mg105_2695 [Gemmatales bacterium]|nr:MAG: hypothetical protein KatS3mg105_2695 [Gemmatales bacterium]